MARSVDDILRDARATFETAQLGLDDLDSADGPRRFAGARNVAVFGRSVTFVIQNLNGKVAGFEDWYGPIQERMKGDPVMGYFLELRNRILKQGSLPTTTRVIVAELDAGDTRPWGRPPRGAISRFIGDEYGGSGWMVELSDGSTIPYYVKLPSDKVRVEQFFAEIPVKFEEAVSERPLEELAKEYLAKMAEILSSCEKEFGPKSKTAPASQRSPYLKRIK
ncbi:hypothetical protein [Salinisphaera hydrothermalis]|uniref:hypothetical protein n=1 Tax=Salinisphaera hydrothermalis TaxID=563188 RepID=UPI0033421557